MRILTNVSVRDAVRSGIGCGPKAIIEVSDDQLNSLTEEERDQLAKNLKDSKESRIDAEYSGSIKSPTIDGLFAAVRENLAFNQKRNQEMESWKKKKLEEEKCEIEKIISEGPEGLIDGKNSNRPSLNDHKLYLCRKDLRGKDFENQAREMLLSLRNAADRRDKEEKQKKLDEMKSWIENHGSVKLKLAFKNGFNVSDLYVTERLDKERPGWFLYQDFPYSTSKLGSDIPDEDILLQFEEISKQFPNAKIRACSSGFVAFDEFLEYSVVFTIGFDPKENDDTPQEEDDDYHEWAKQ